MGVVTAIQSGGIEDSVADWMLGKHCTRMRSKFGVWVDGGVIFLRWRFREGLVNDCSAGEELGVAIGSA